MQIPYEEFLRSKVVSIPQLGFDIDPGEVNPFRPRLRTGAQLLSRFGHVLQGGGRTEAHAEPL